MAGTAVTFRRPGRRADGGRGDRGVDLGADHRGHRRPGAGDRGLAQPDGRRRARPVALLDPAAASCARSAGAAGGCPCSPARCWPAHFATWVPSVTLTSVASSTALVATQPVWAALLARAAGRQVGRPVWIGILVAVAGAAHDHRRGRDALRPARSPATCWPCSAASSPPRYVTAGAAVRVRISTTSYTTVCYSACALLLALVCVLAAASRWPATPPAPGSSWPRSPSAPSCSATR